MMSKLFIGRDAFISFSGFITGMTLIILALFWLLFGEKEYIAKTRYDNKNATQDPFVITTKVLTALSLVILAFMIAPGTSLLIKKLIGNHPYAETMIALPSALIVAYAFIHLVKRLNIAGKKRIGIVFCLVVLMFINITIPISYGYPLSMEFITNPMKISPETKELCKKIGSSYVLLPEEIYGQIGEYDSDVNADSLYTISHDRYYAFNVCETAIKKDAPLFVIRKTDDYPGMMEAYHYLKIDETKHYLIYQRSE